MSTPRERAIDDQAHAARDDLESRLLTGVVAGRLRALGPDAYAAAVLAAGVTDVDVQGLDAAGPRRCPHLPVDTPQAAVWTTADPSLIVCLACWIGAEVAADGQLTCDLCLEDPAPGETRCFAVLDAVAAVGIFCDPCLTAQVTSESVVPDAISNVASEMRRAWLSA